MFASLMPIKTGHMPSTITVVLLSPSLSDQCFQYNREQNEEFTHITTSFVGLDELFHKNNRRAFPSVLHKSFVDFNLTSICNGQQISLKVTYDFGSTCYRKKREMPRVIQRLLAWRQVDLNSVGIFTLFVCSGISYRKYVMVWYLHIAMAS